MVHDSFMADHIQVTLPDGSKKEVPQGTTPLEIARGISPRLADAALVAKIKHSALSSQHSAHQHSGRIKKSLLITEHW